MGRDAGLLCPGDYGTDSVECFLTIMKYRACRLSILHDNTTPEQISTAAKRAFIHFSSPCDYRCLSPYAVVIDYENRKSCVLLLKNQIILPFRSSFESMGGMAIMKTVAVIHENGL